MVRVISFSASSWKPRATVTNFVLTSCSELAQLDNPTSESNRFNTNVLTNGEEEIFEREPLHKYIYISSHWRCDPGCFLDTFGDGMWIKMAVRMSQTDLENVTIWKGAAAAGGLRIKPSRSLCCLLDVSGTLSAQRFSRWKQAGANGIVCAVSQLLQSYLSFLLFVYGTLIIWRSFIFKI